MGLIRTMARTLQRSSPIARSCCVRVCVAAARAASFARQPVAAASRAGRTFAQALGGARHRRLERCSMTPAGEHAQGRDSFLPQGK